MDKNKLVSFIESRGYKINAETRDLLYDKLVSAIVKLLRGKSMIGGMIGAPLDWNNMANNGAGEYRAEYSEGTNTSQTNMTRQAINSTFESVQVGGNCNMCQSGGNSHMGKKIKFITIKDLKQIATKYNITLIKGEEKNLAEKLSAKINDGLILLLQNATKMGVINNKAVNKMMRAVIPI